MNQTLDTSVLLDQCAGVIRSAALTQLGDAAHSGCQQRLFQCAELRLGVAGTLAAPPRALLVAVQVQALRQAQSTCGQRKNTTGKIQSISSNRTSESAGRSVRTFTLNTPECIHEIRKQC